MSVSDRRWGANSQASLPSPTASVEWTTTKIVDTLKLGHHAVLLEDVSFEDLMGMSSADIKTIPSLPLGPAIKITRKLAEIRSASRDAAFFRENGIQLGKPVAPVRLEDEGPVFKPGVSLTLRKKPSAPAVTPATVLFANNDTERVQESMGRRRRPTITLAPSEEEQLRKQLELVQEQDDLDNTRESNVPSNFFNLFGLTEKSQSTKSRPEEVLADTETPEEKEDVLNMQLNPTTGKLEVQSGSFSDVLDCVIFYVNISKNFLDEMLFTHGYFCSGKHLLNAFKAHFVNTQNVGNQAKTSEESRSAQKVMEQVQERLVGLIETWIESHFYYFDENEELLKYFQRDFIDLVMDSRKAQYFHNLIDATIIIRNHHTAYRSQESSVAKDEVLSQILREDKSGLIMDRRKNLRSYKQAFVAVEAINLIMRKLKIADRNVAILLLDCLRQKGSIVNVVKETEFEDGDSLWQFKHTHPAPPVREDATPTDVSRCNPLSLAEQLTLLEFKVFQQIVPPEISHQAWSKDGGSRAPNVMTLITGFNKTTYWVSSEVCNQQKMDQRVIVLTRFIEIAERCEQIHNFQTLMEILVGLSMGPVSRLTETWDQLSKDKLASFERLQRLIDNRKNYNNYRTVLKDSPLPAFPYVGLSLKDLTFIEDGNENYTDDKKQVINWQKMRMISDVFSNMQRFQQHPYEFEEKPLMRAWLETGRQVVTDDNELYELSFKCQPKKTKS